MRKQAVWVTVLCCVAGLSLAACVPSVEHNANEGEGEAAVLQEGAYPEGAGLEEVFKAMEERSVEYAPEVKTLEDGTQVQLTPDDVGGYMHYAGTSASYNTYYLNADNRGCVSCHEAGLDDLLNNKMKYDHISMTNNLGTDVTPMDCRVCHDAGTGYFSKNFEFGSLVHGIHSKDSFKGDCLSCHNATSDGNGVRLWEEAKYDTLQGIFSIANATGDFSYEQDTLSDMFKVSWVAGDLRSENTDKGMQGKELDPEVFDTWEISVSGKVDKPFTMTLPEIIAEAPSETFISSTQCVMNGPGGELVANVEVTGVPFSWFLEKAGVQEGATALMSTAPDGWSRGNLLSNMEKNDGYLVYEINGERLDWEEGYPAVTWYPGRAVPANIRWVSDLEVVDTPPEKVKIYGGWKVDEMNALDPSEIGT